MTTFDQHIRQFNLGRFVVLYQIDTTVVGGTDVLYFTPMTDGNDAELVFDSQAYKAIPVSSNGWDWTSDGAPPQPRIRVDNTNKYFFSYVVGLGDLVGAPVTRIRTYEHFLDGQPDADVNATYAKDKMIIKAKVEHNREFIEWQLIHQMERPGLKLPGRQILRDQGFPGVSRTTF